MITAIIYLIDALILGIFSYHVFRSPHKNPFMTYFLGVTAFFSINFLAYSFFILFALYTKNPSYLFWADYLGRIFVYLGSVFAIQVLLYELAPKSKLRYLGSVVVALLGVGLAVTNLFYRNIPFVDNLEIVHWQTPTWLGLGLAVIILGIWIPTSLIFINQYVKSKFRLRKSLLLGMGFLLGAIGSALQDFGKSTFSYILINSVLAIGFLLIFWGVFYRDKNDK